MTVELHDLSGRADLERLSELFQEIWGAEQPLTPVPWLRALSDTGGMVLGAHAGAELVGGAVGFRTVADPACLHSHIVGVRAQWRGRRVGSVIKHQQRAWCLARGMTRMSWTFDPLVQRNAIFNIGHLGAVGVAYLPDHYGPMADRFNAGVPTDRVLVLWHLDQRRERPAPGDAATVLDVGPRGEPRPVGTATAGAVRLRLPAEVPPEQAVPWREALRAVLAPRLAADYRWTGMSRDGWCVLQEAG